MRLQLRQSRLSLAATINIIHAVAVNVPRTIDIDQSLFVGADRIQFLKEHPLLRLVLGVGDLA